MKSGLSTYAGLVAAAAVAFTLAGCNPSSTSSDEPASAATDAPGSTEQAERRNREDIIAEYEAALAEARETSGNGETRRSTCSARSTSCARISTGARPNSTRLSTAPIRWFSKSTWKAKLASRP